ncbi:MAG: 4'-phosphopantetheinyl transferase superfamily protein [Pseudomonadota bacterium]
MSPDTRSAALPRPRAGEVHLWFALADGAPSEPKLAAQYASWLSADERERWARFRFERDRDRYLLARGLVRATLSRYVPGRAEAAWRFRNNAHGRPFIAHGQQPPGDALYFSLSHTQGLVALAIARCEEIGVDVEPLDRDGPHLEMAERFFAPAEATALRALAGPAAHRKRFVELWTLKESYIKARGMGMALPLDGFAFDLNRPEEMGFRTWASARDRAEGWRFGLFEYAASHRVALALREHRAADTALRIRAGVFPGAGAAPGRLPLALTRRSTAVLHIEALI